MFVKINTLNQYFAMGRIEKSSRAGCGQRPTSGPSLLLPQKSLIKKNRTACDSGAKPHIQVL